MRGAVVAVLLISLSGLAGCLGDGKAPSGGPKDITLPIEREIPGNNTTGDAPPVTGLGPLAAPTWSVGDFWEISSAALHGTDTVLTKYTAVVVSAGPDGYVLGAGDNNTTYIDGLLTDLLPVGAFDAALAPTWNGAALPMFQWPLENGATWAADVALDADDDAPTALTFNVGFAPGIDTPYGLRPGYRVSALTNGTLLFAYNYVPAAAWLTAFEEFDENGNRVRWFTVTGWGGGWNEPAYTLDVETLFDRTVVLTSAGEPRSTFPVADGFSYLFVWVHGRELATSTYQQRLVLLDEANAIRGNYGYDAYRPPGSPGCGILGCLGVPSQWTQWDTLAADAGTWTALFENVGHGELQAKVSGVTDVVHQL